MVKKNFVTKEEMGESWTEMVSAAERLQGLVDRPYKYSLWITNISFALLGFYIAILLQIRSNGPLTNIPPILIILIAIVIPIAFGLFYRVKFEIIDLYKTLKLDINKIEFFINEVDNKLGNKIKDDDHGLNSKKDSISSTTLEKWKKELIIYGLLFQFVFFIIALILVIMFLLKYLFN